MFDFPRTALPLAGRGEVRGWGTCSNIAANPLAPHPASPRFALLTGRGVARLRRSLWSDHSLV